MVCQEGNEVRSTLRARLPGTASVYTAEIYAILAAYTQIQISKISKAFIISDSLAALKSI